MSSRLGRLSAPRALCLAALGAFALSACDEGDGLSRLELGGTYEPAALDFGNVTVGSTKPAMVTFRNSGQVGYTLDEVLLSTSFSLRGLDEPLEGRALAPGATVSFSVVFQPATEGPRSDVLVLASGDTRFELPLAGVGVVPTRSELVVDPTSLDFGEIPVGTTDVKSLLVRNQGTAEATLTGFVLASIRSDASAGTIFATRTPAPVKVPAEGSVQIDVAFTPPDATGYTEILEIISPSLSLPLQVNLSGRGPSEEPAGTLACTPASLAFGTVERGSDAPLTLTCTPQNGRITVTGASSSNASDFAITQPPPAQAFGTGQSFDVVVEFRATGTLGPRMGTLVIDYQGAQGAEQVRVSMSGTVGAPPATATAFTIQLDWDTNDTDLDLHLTGPNGAPFAFRDCYFGDTSPDWGVPGDPADDCFLDVDDVDGLGPERINVGRAAAGTYRVYIHYFEDARRRGNTAASVTVNLGGQQVGVYRRAGLICNDMWLVGEIRWDGMTGTFVQVDRVDWSLFGRCF